MNKPNKAAKLNIYVDGTVVGFVVADTFYKSVSRKQHFLTDPPAIAFAVTSLEDAADVGANWVQVYDRDKNITYYASLKRIWEDGFNVQRAGFEPQRALLLEKFTSTPEKTVQLELWEGV